MAVKRKSVPESKTPLEFAWVDAKALQPNPKNARVHPRRQLQAFKAQKSKVGWAGAVLVNKTTGFIIDGHMRYKEALDNGEQIPVLYGTWTEAQENLILANHDAIGALASINREAMDNLIKANTKRLSDLNNENNKRLLQLAKDLETTLEEQPEPFIKQSKPVSKKQIEEELEKAKPDSNTEDDDDLYDLDGSYDPPEDSSEIETVVTQSEVFFASGEHRAEIPLQLPELLPEMLATSDMAPRDVFNRSKTQEHTPQVYYCYSSTPWPIDRDGGVLGFFTDDYRFNHAYDFANRMLDDLREDDWTAIMLPDYSLNDEFPIPMKLWNLYRSRWCGRYWQEAGFYVIPIVQFFGGLVGWTKATKQIVIDTLPEVVPLLACQLRKNEELELSCKLLNYAVETKQVETLVIYGGQEKQKKIHGLLTDSCEIIYLPQFVTARKRILKTEK